MTCKVCFALDLSCIFLIDKYYFIPSLLIFSSANKIIKPNLLIWNGLFYSGVLSIHSCHWLKRHQLLRTCKETGLGAMVIKHKKKIQGYYWVFLQAINKQIGQSQKYSSDPEMQNLNFSVLLFLHFNSTCMEENPLSSSNDDIN